MKKKDLLLKMISRGAFVALGLFVFFGMVQYTEAEGELDPTFNTGSGAEPWATIYDIAIQSNDKILIGGSFSTYNGVARNDIARINIDGSLDTSFNPGSGVDGALNAIAIQSNGKILIGGGFSTYNGVSRNGIARLNDDGSLDTSFDPGSGVSNSIWDIVIQSDGKILISGDFTTYGGSSRGYIARLNDDGSLDTSFNSSTGASDSVKTIALQSDGKVIIGGQFAMYDWASSNKVARLNDDGSLDTNFVQSAGITGPVQSISIQPDGKLIVAGNFAVEWGTGPYNRIARLNDDGSLDTSFDPGSGSNAMIWKTLIQPDGKILIGGYYTSTYDGVSRNNIARINTNGSLDTSFDPGSGTNDSVFALALQSDEKILIGGGFTSYNGTSVNAFARLNGSPPSLSDIIIPDPTPAQINSRVSEGYMSITDGTINNTTSTQTNVNVTYRTKDVDALFPTGTVVTEASSNAYNFENFTIQNITNTTKSEQPASRVAFRLGIEGTNLTFSQPITITTFIGEAFNNQTLDILYQNEGETTWNTQGTCTVENGQCTFTTDHATIYTINGTLQSTGDAPMNINTEVVDTLTLDCYDTTNGSGNYDVLLGTVSNPGYVTAGTPAVGTSTCDVTTNDDQGYYLTVEDDNGISSTVLTHTDPNTGTIYEIQDLTEYTEITPNTINWNAPTTKGLGFSVITFPDTTPSNNTLGTTWTNTHQCPEGTTPDSNDYAGIPDTPETIAAVPQYTANQTTTTICYKVDVPTSQPSGTYTGSVTYTATSDASSYVN
jgi:uncharacterized delta-60 repeat protein